MLNENKPKIYDTHPEFASLLLNKNDAKLYSYGSHTKVNWICPNCGSIVKQKSILKVISRNHIPCKRCSDGISYPNKYMYNMLLQLNVTFISEYMPDWIKPKRYDFFIPDKNIIIEMDGNIGHGNKTFDGHTSEETLEIDNYKDRLAEQHGINVIRIDCRRSDSDYIRNNILESKLSTLFNLNDVDFLLCNKLAYSSLKIKVCNIWNQYHEMEHILQETKLPRVTIIKYLKDCNKYGLCDYNPKQQMKESGYRNISKAYSVNRKKVRCLETNDVFESCRKAYEWLGYHVDGHSIQDNCNGITQSAGKHPITKQKLHWEFYKEDSDERLVFN